MKAIVAFSTSREIRSATAHAPPYLCDFEVLKVRSKFQLEGIHGGQLPPAVQRRLVAEGKDIENIDFEGTPTWNARSPTPAPTP